MNNRRIVFELNGSPFPIKRIIGESFQVQAVVFCDGHESLYSSVLFRHENERHFQRVELTEDGNDVWTGVFPLEKVGRYSYCIEAGIVESAGVDKAAGSAESKSLSRSKPLQIIDVDPPLAQFSTWYEFFPRSTFRFSGEFPGELSCEQPGQHGTFRDCEKKLEYVASLGFDVVYFPPIHPIGKTHRKGKNNTTKCEPGDVGSPWAIGGEAGGFRDIHPQLGTFDDFDRLLLKARRLGLEIALDLAFQASPDHPYVQQHPEWFLRRPDGSICCAENPPKKYEDIYPFNFEGPHAKALWEELKSVVLFWVEKGIRVFRVDNPHTKPFRFWKWLIREVKKYCPEVIFLAEAFTRPHPMKYLAKIGFNQSYTYFTWRNTKAELTEYLTELTQTGLIEFFRPNFWPNTPDILPGILQTGGRAAFIQRLVLAATLSSTYGIYGPAFEVCENRSKEVAEGLEPSEEYLHSEKYELKNWDLKSPGSLAPILRQVNQIRKENSALWKNHSLQFHPISNEKLIAYSKEKANSRILTIVNLDPHQKQSGTLELSLCHRVRDLFLLEESFWKGDFHPIEIDPSEFPARIYKLIPSGGGAK